MGLIIVIETIGKKYFLPSDDGRTSGYERNFRAAKAKSCEKLLQNSKTSSGRKEGLLRDAKPFC
jgi:hypothetical protein